MGKTIPLTVRFRAKVAKQPDGCWLWTAATNGTYGQIQVKRKLRYAHRVSYEIHIGTIPDGMQIDHLCGTKLCVNPSHLQPVTPRTNTWRSPLAHGKEITCPSGHPYAGDNLYVWTDKRGYTRRQCRTCRKVAKDRYEARHLGR